MRIERIKLDMAEDKLNILMERMDEQDGSRTKSALIHATKGTESILTTIMTRDILFCSISFLLCMY